MKRALPSSLSPELRAAQIAIDRWRARNGGRRRIPEAFWQRAAELARTHSINSVSQAMGLSHKRVKARCDKEAEGDPTVAGFVELKPSAAEAFSDPPTTMTLRFGDATRRHVEVRGADSRCASQLIAVFFDEAVTA